MAEVPALSFFSQADGQLERFINLDRFYWDLTSRILLEAGVVIPDVFFLISSHVREDVWKREGSWIAGAIEKGLVAPAFRELDLTFKDMHSEIVKNQEVRGALDDSSGTAQLLSRLNVRTKFVWGEGMGLRYRSKVEDYFLQGVSDLSRSTSDDRLLWESTEPIRRQIFDRALDLSKDPLKNGVRRATLLEALAQVAKFDGDYLNSCRTDAFATAEAKKAVRGCDFMDQ